MKASYAVSPLLLLLPVAIALPLLPANNIEAGRLETLQAKRQHEGSAYNVLAPTIDSNKAFHDLQLNRQTGGAVGHDQDGTSWTQQKREAPTDRETYENPEAGWHHWPHKPLPHHHRPNNNKVGGEVTNSTGLNSPAHAQTSSNVMPAVAPQPMAGSSTGQAPQPAPGTIPSPNDGGPPHRDLRPRELSERQGAPVPDIKIAMKEDFPPKWKPWTPKSARGSYLASPIPAPDSNLRRSDGGSSNPPIAIPDASAGKNWSPQKVKLANHTHVNDEWPKGAARPNFRPASLGGITPLMGHGPVVPGKPWTPASDSGALPGTNAPAIPREMNAVMASPKFRPAPGDRVKRNAEVMRPQSNSLGMTDKVTDAASRSRARSRASLWPG